MDFRLASERGHPARLNGVAVDYFTNAARFKRAGCPRSDKRSNGITYKGGDLALRRYVAIKEFFPSGSMRNGALVAPRGMSEADFASVKAKFIEEARTLAKFSHPGIVRVFGVFEENNTAYMAMAFLERCRG